MKAPITDRPILFSAPMVRALLAGTKTQARRAVRIPAGYVMSERDDGTPWPWYASHAQGDTESPWLRCPYGEVGDMLWVRESWGLHGHGDYTWWCRDSIKGRTEDDLRLSYEVAYAADATSAYDHWRPSIHMPRWASRITLRVTSVRVERVQDISEEDARAEGCVGFYDRVPSHRETFTDLWISINGAESWEANPWVWVVGFERVEAAHG